ncbi:MAG: hypothetical protein ABI761_13675 [Saprospiraceae bacterium]
MRFFFFILTGFLAFGTGHISTNKHYSITSTRYIETVEGVIIQNSLPKGGPYTDPTGKRFGYGIFWTRIINETAYPLNLTINFPGDSFAIFPQPESYLKLFLPPDIMTLDKESLYDYGATGLKSFLDTGLNRPTMLQKTIHPKEEYLFYIGILFHLPDNGPVRTGLVLKEQDLFYRISIAGQLDSALIPCGNIIFNE